MEYVEEQDRRRDRMNEIHAKVKKPDTSPALNRRNCSLCLLSFPMDAIIGSVTVKNLKSLSKKWKVQFQKFGEGVSESALLMQHRIPVCSFCEQVSACETALRIRLSEWLKISYFSPLLLLTHNSAPAVLRP